jgi:hypothetical protein
LGDDLRCFRCNVGLVEADPAAGARRRRLAQEQRWRRVGIGMFLGAILVPAVGVGGGPVGLALAGGVAGASLGMLLGLVYGLIEGAGWALLMGDTSWVPFWAWCSMGIGFVAGMVAGWSGDAGGSALILLGGAAGGTALGGLLAAFADSPAESAS